MKKKSTKKISKTSSKEQLKSSIDNAKNLLSAHGILCMFIVAGIAIGLALYRSNIYLNPSRDEVKYDELTAGVNFNKIDYKLVERLSQALNDANVTVTQSTVPGRNNPFSE